MRVSQNLVIVAISLLVAVMMCACSAVTRLEPASSSSQASSSAVDESQSSAVSSAEASTEGEDEGEQGSSSGDGSAAGEDEDDAHEDPTPVEEDAPASAPAALPALNLSEDYRASFVHGDKPAQFQKYIVLHDTEGDSDAEGVIGYWDGNGAGVAAHFVVNKDGSIVQCVPLDKITHHAGFGDTGHNALYGVEDESRDDKVGTTPIGDWAADYGMNSYSVGIEMVHAGGSGYYPEEQLDAVDALIAYIDSYYGFQSAIIDHKAWRSGNSDTSPEFAGYLANYQDHRTHS